MTSSANSARYLEGNGVSIVREIALATRIQKGLERLYQLERVVDVEHYIAVEDTGRETLWVRETEEGLELALRIPALQGESLDALCQIIEGVSHFVYIADRAAREQSTTQLELELQAEVDKYVVLSSARPDLDTVQRASLRRSLYEETAYVDEADTEAGQRYRIANQAAHRFVRRLEQKYMATQQDLPSLRQALREFYQMGLEDKLRETMSQRR